MRAILLMTLVVSIAMPSQPSQAGGPLEAGNGVYEIFLAVDPGVLANCGQWTGRTGELHEAGGGLEITFGGGTPASSYTTLHSFTSGNDYTTGAIIDCTAICEFTAPVVEALTVDDVVVGFRAAWVVPDGAGPLVELVQELVVEGPVDGSQTADNTLIRETHTVRNLGPGGFRFGLRKLWDWQVGLDDGPVLGSCTTPDQACDQPQRLIGGPVPGATIPTSVFVTDQAPFSGCIDGQAPDQAGGCGGTASYRVSLGLRQATTDFKPRPTTPDSLLFGGWSSLFGNCWDAPLMDDAVCGVGSFPNDDTAGAAYYGKTIHSSRALRPGQSMAFTSYLGAGGDGCPDPFMDAGAQLPGGTAVEGIEATLPAGPGQLSTPVMVAPGQSRVRRHR